MDTILPALAGGALAIIGTLVGTFAGRHGKRERWRRDLQIELSTDALAALQRLIRRPSIWPTPSWLPRDTTVIDTPTQREIRTTFEAAVTVWNAAIMPS